MFDPHGNHESIIIHLINHSDMEKYFSEETNTNEYALRNILKSLDAATTYCSFINDSTMRYEIEEIIADCQSKICDLTPDNEE